MNATDPVSATFQPVDDQIDLNGPYGEPQLLMSTASARIYRISRAGKRMLLKTPADDSGRCLDLLKREYALGVGLSHPNVGAIYTWEPDTPAGPGILMEYVDGRTLDAFLAENPSLNARRRLFRQILDAVGYIHRHGVTHNDLKPGNILVSRANNDVKIIDFGLSDADGEVLRRQLGGTLGYASPELRARDANADMRSDIYSAGVVMRDIFGRRYRRIWRKCTAENPRKRYSNIDSLDKAWRRRQKLPALIWSLTAVMALAILLTFGLARIESLDSEVALSSQTAKEMADTISALRRHQLMANDSITSLNLQLSQISRDKALTDSLTQTYIAGSRRVIEKYKGVTRKMRCFEEAPHMFKLFAAEMDRSDSLFLARNPVAGREIYDKYGMSTRLKGTTEIEALAKKLPSLHELTSDVDELMTVMPLVQSGQPWRLKSDP